jgi:hypothetical protein
VARQSPLGFLAAAHRDQGGRDGWESEHGARYRLAAPDPPAVPDHPSGHLGLSGSWVETLQEFFGTDTMSWTDTNAAGTRSYDSFSSASNESIEVRIWSGIHFRAADEQAADIGKKIANWRKAHYFEKRP